MNVSMYCTQCGQALGDSDTWCPHCGQPVTRRLFSQESQPPSYPSQPLVSGAAQFPDPASMPMPGYGQPQMPSGSYGQAAPSSYSSYPGYPSMGQSAPPSGYSGMQAPPWGPQPIQYRSRGKGKAIIISVIIAVVVIACAGLGVYNLTSNRGTSGLGTSSETIVFHDPLTSDTNGWTNDSHCSFQDGGYAVNGGYICYAPTSEYGNIALSVNVKQTSGPVVWFYGLVFRRASQGNYYAFYIDSNGKWQFSKVVNEQETDIVPYVPNAAIQHGLNATNALRVVAKGTHFAFYVNGVMVGQADDATFTTGRCGVAGDSHIQVVYNDFTLSLAS